MIAAALQLLARRGGASRSCVSRVVRPEMQLLAGARLVGLELGRRERLGRRLGAPAAAPGRRGGRRLRIGGVSCSGGRSSGGRLARSRAPGEEQDRRARPGRAGSGRAGGRTAAPRSARPPRCPAPAITVPSPKGRWKRLPSARANSSASTPPASSSSPASTNENGAEGAHDQEQRGRGRGALLEVEQPAARNERPRELSHRRAAAVPAKPASGSCQKPIASSPSCQQR